MRIVSLVWVVLVVGLPDARATIGIAERERVFHYGKYGTVESLHNDICGVPGRQGKDCIALKSLGPGNSAVYEETDLLDQISVPQDDGNPCVIAQRRFDGRWIVYDLARQELLIETPDYQEALQQWEFLGLKPPLLVTVKSLPGHFRETRESAAEQFRLQIMLLSYFLFTLFFLMAHNPLILLMVFGVFFAVFWMFFARFKKKH